MATVQEYAEELALLFFSSLLLRHLLSITNARRRQIIVRELLLQDLAFLLSARNLLACLVIYLDYLLDGALWPQALLQALAQANYFLNLSALLFGEAGLKCFATLFPRRWAPQAGVSLLRCSKEITMPSLLLASWSKLAEPRAMHGIASMILFSF